MFVILHPYSIQGLVAERLGRGLQNLLHQFESGRDLQESLQIIDLQGFFYQCF